jgi:RimJ/RimL family protein N-acetyltransferase
MIDIVPLAETHFAQLHQLFDAISREKKYFVFLEAGAEAETYAYYRSVLKNGWPHRVAVEGDEVLGWCDIIPRVGGAVAHAGTLGIGLKTSARGKGLGAQLMHATIHAAWVRGFTRVQLDVRCDNLNAVALYRRIGFVIEGTNRNAHLVDGQYFDSYSMALLNSER